MCGGEAPRNPRLWTDNRLWNCLATHDDLVSHNSLRSRQLPQYKKLNYVMPACGFLWSQLSQASVAGLWPLCSGWGICDRLAMHLFEVGRFSSVVLTRGWSGGQETTHAWWCYDCQSLAGQPVRVGTTKATLSALQHVSVRKFIAAANTY